MYKFLVNGDEFTLDLSGKTKNFLTNISFEDYLGILSCCYKFKNFDKIRKFLDGKNRGVKEGLLLLFNFIRLEFPNSVPYMERDKWDNLEFLSVYIPIQGNYLDEEVSKKLSNIDKMVLNVIGLEFGKDVTILIDFQK